MGGLHLVSDMGSTRTTTLITFASTTTLSTIMVSQLCYSFVFSSRRCFVITASFQGTFAFTSPEKIEKKQKNSPSQPFSFGFAKFGR